ncbi:MAG: PTS sugar transporter subunit IIC [Elusimicrobia bacterium]|nr:PTS sugar transporter subunit IIC [Elusimicrobiota bacterium]
MILILKALISSALAGLLELDTVQAGQFLLSRPALVGPLLGALNGCVLEGARLGVLIELIYIDFIPVGGVVPPNGAVAAAVGVLAHAWAGLAPSLAFFTGLFAGGLYSFVEYHLRSSRSRRNSVIEAGVKAGSERMNYWVADALLGESAAVSLYVFLFSGVIFLAGRFFKLETLTPAMNFAYSLMPWLGLSGLYFRFRAQIYKKGSG